MDLAKALDWKPDLHRQHLTVIDSHAAGEPFRVVINGLPEIPGDTMQERRRFATEHFDGLRKTLMWEPRGHADMYGGWIGLPVEEDSDLSVLFLHNDGFSTMCGHGIIALTKVVLDTGVLPVEAPETTVRIDTPAGQITAIAQVTDGLVGEVRFRNVPSFAADLDAIVAVPTIGQVTYDLGFGGAFYAYVDAESVGVGLADPTGLVSAGRVIKQAVSSSRSIDHPTDPELGFLYGVIFTGKPENPANHSRNVCIFADGEVDRSPTGTGVSGRLAILHARGRLDLGEPITVESIVGSEFTGRISETTSVGDQPAIIPEISGTAHLLGRAEFWFDLSDELGSGFLLR